MASGFAVDPAKVCCPSIGTRFSDEVDAHRIAARGNMWPIINGEPKNRTVYPWGHKFDIDQQAVSDCALSATMLSGAVENSLPKCNYECDTEFGCDYCIPKGIVAAPAESSERSPPSSGGASSSAGPPAQSYRLGRNTRIIDAVTHETRTSHGVIRERVVEEADGTMYTQITLPDGTVERDYW